MLYAKIVLGLPVEGPFDYSVPKPLEKRLKVGSRVRVSFGTRKLIGYVVGVSHASKIKNVKEISALIDERPLLDDKILSLTKNVSSYYGCSWGEAIEAALPQALRQGRALAEYALQEQPSAAFKKEIVLVHDQDGSGRWRIYLEFIKKALASNQGVLFIVPDLLAVESTKQIIEKEFALAALTVLSRKKTGECEEWEKIKSGKARFVVGSRSAVFAPLFNLGLLILDEEQDQAYKQDQTPHYHARDIAIMRARLEPCTLVLGSSAPSVESFYLSQQEEVSYIRPPLQKALPEIKILDTRFEFKGTKLKQFVFGQYMIDTIAQALEARGKVLIFLNRKGFATLAACNNCQKHLRCPRCNINLVYHFKEALMTCHFCNFKMALPSLCPYCNAGYIRFSGTGTETIESELSRLFPQARIAREETGHAAVQNEADIVVATSAIIRKESPGFTLTCVLGIDNALGRVDFRAGEKTFEILSGLCRLSQGKMLIQTALPQHHCFQAFIRNDIPFFYETELKQRKQLQFPPFRHFINVKVRGKKDDAAKAIAETLFKKLTSSAKGKKIVVVSLNRPERAQLRGNFYWQILVSCKDPRSAIGFLKERLKGFLRSGTIITIDVDPL